MIVVTEEDRQRTRELLGTRPIDLALAPIRDTYLPLSTEEKLMQSRGVTNNVHDLNSAFCLLSRDLRVLASLKLDEASLPQVVSNDPSYAKGLLERLTIMRKVGAKL